ncbi:MAG: hypothetical protein AABY52_02455 [Deltaproteobacteria bacterium]
MVLGLTMTFSYLNIYPIIKLAHKFHNPMPSAKNNNPGLNQSLEQLLKERFVHSLSDIVYDKVSTLWHIDKESEKIMAQIASRVVVGFFCLEYLSHINSMVKEKVGIKEGITAKDLSDEDLAAGIKARISNNKDAAGIFRNSAGFLKKVVDSIDIKTLEDLTKIAHTGDYLLSALRDMKDSNHDEYAVWLSSVPYYYEKDLRHLGLIQDAGFGINDALSSWDEFAAAPFYCERIYSNHRINLNAHLHSGATKDGYFPCAAQRPEGIRRRKDKDKKAYVVTRS